MNIQLSHRPSEAETKIFAAIQSIVGRKPDISDDLCRSYAYQLYIIWASQDLDRMMPRKQTIGSRRTKTELAEVSKLAKRLFVKVENLHMEATKVIEENLPKCTTVASVRTILSSLYSVGRRSNIKETVAMPPIAIAAAITPSAADVFEKVTGRKPTLNVRQVPDDSERGTRTETYGPFLDFLTAVFTALRIEASAEHYARQLRRNRT